MRPSLLLLALLPVLVVAQTPRLRVKGKDLVTTRGKKVNLRGCNLGNWLLLEMWMLNQSDAAVGDQHLLFEVLDRRFGRAKREALMEKYREAWITDADFETIKSYRFNTVRLPMDYRLFEDDNNPMVLRKDAWKWTDRCVKLARKHGIYVILDMHGVQGGQSPYDHTGRSGQNKFWTDKGAQERSRWLWEKVADRYKDNPTVVAYDLANEPYGGTHDQQVEQYTAMLNAVRKVDKEKLVYVHGHWDGFDHYGDPAKNGWHNVGYQLHFYPGLFGNGPATKKNHAKHIANLADTAKKVDALNVPFLVGEFNPVFGSLGANMLRYHYDAHEGYGWASTMWSYKVVSKEGGYAGGTWGMVTNAKPIAKVDFEKDSLERIEAWIDDLTGSNWVAYEPLRKSMAPKRIKLAPLPPVTPPTIRTSAPADTGYPEMAQVAVGGAAKGAAVHKGTVLELYGGGEDIWNVTDSFQFLYREVSGDFTAEVTVASMDDLQQYAKAGWMLRASLEADSNHFLVSTFPDGGIQTAERVVRGGGTNGTGDGSSDLPVKLRIQRKGTTVIASYQTVGKPEWVKLKASDRPDLGGKAYLGLVACSHDKSSLLRVAYQDVHFFTGN